MANIKIDTAKINSAISSSFDRTVERTSEAMDYAIDADLYDYPRTTQRKSGEIVGSPRNLVDLGNLKDSKVVSRSSDGNAAEFSWSVDYSLAVHEGYTTKTGKDVPPRKWTEKGIEEADPITFFGDALGREL